jgi:hypothetical protein
LVELRPAGFVATPAPPVHACDPARRRAFLAGYHGHVDLLQRRRLGLRPGLCAEGFGGVVVSPTGWQGPRLVGGVGGRRGFGREVEGGARAERLPSVPT